MKNSGYTQEKLKDIYQRFKVEGTFESARLFGNGLINKTFLIKTDVKEYMLQVINSYAFHNIDDLMRNIYIVTNHLRGMGKPTLHVRKTYDKKIYVVEDGIYYRLFSYIKNTVAYDKLDSLEMVAKSGEAFGDFHCALADLDPILIAETIPDFHNTPKRLENLLEASKSDPCRRLKDCFDLLTLIIKHKDSIGVIQNSLHDGSIPTRIVHNDPKINNVLFDNETGQIRCVVDLDTIMPGSCLFDFGDALRSLFTGDNESNRDSSLLKVDLNVFETYTRGYLSKMKDSLTPKELELLPQSIFVLAMELGIRFLTDYIQGDKYFKVTFEDENLVRAKGQIALAQDVANNLSSMTEIVNKILKE